MRIVTWNMNHWQRTDEQRAASSEYLWKSIKPDVALLQEAAPPFPAPDVSRVGGIDSRRPWGSAVVSGLPLQPVTSVRSAYGGEEVDLLRTYPGCVAVADVTVGDSEHITAVSVYGVWDAGYADTTMHRIISDLTPLFDSTRWKRIVLGGDFNVSTQCDPPQRARDKTVFDRLQSLGLVDLLALQRPKRTSRTDCWCDDKGSCGHVHTHKHNKSTRPWHNDYLFASKDLVSKVKSCAAVDDPDIWTYSDHCPVVAEIDVP